MSEFFPIVQIGYWLALATWFGGVLFIAIAAPVILRTIADADPTLPKVLSVNLEAEHSSLLAGSIVANLLTMLTRIELICAAVLLIAIGVQLERQWQPPVYGIIRASLFVGAVVLTVYRWRVLWPRIETQRQTYIDNADNPEVADPAKDQFDKYQHEVATILMIMIGLLLGIILFSAMGRAAAPFTIYAGGN